MKDIDYRNLKPGDRITVVTAWGENETFEDIARNHFFETRIEQVYFEPIGELGYLRIFAKDGDDNRCRVAYVLEDDEIKSAAVIVPLAELKAKPGMISLTARKREFVAALSRGAKSRLEVFADFERDTFVVVNHASGKEYRVVLKTENSEVFASCECGDFIYRERVCKHIGDVLADTFFGVPA